MKLIKTTLLSSITTFIRVGSGFISSKVVSLILGPSGLGQIGGFANFLSIVFTFSNGAINNGVIKYTSQYSNEKSNRLKLLISTASIVTLICSISISLPLLIIPDHISTFFFNTILYSQPIRILGISLIFFSFNNLLLSIINGKSLISILTKINSIGTILGLLTTIYLVYFFRIQGALIALVLSQTIIFIISAIFFYKHNIGDITLFIGGLDKKMFKRLTQYSIMALFAALCVPLSQILVRNEIIDRFGNDSAGYWQGMMRISEGLLLVVTTAMSTYYLPKFASIKDQKDLKKEILYGFKIIMPVVTITSLIVYAFRFKIIEILFTNNFIQMENLFLSQLVGDFFKIGAWILSYLMISKSMTKLYIIIEVIFATTFVLISKFLIPFLGIQAVTIAYSINSFLGFVTLVLIFRKTLFVTQ